MDSSRIWFLSKYQRARRKPQVVVVRGDADSRRPQRVHFFSSLQVAFDETFVNRVAVHLGQGRVSVHHFAKQNQELHEIGVRLLPERLLASSVEVVEKRGDGVCERVRFEVVVERVVTEARLEADLDVVVGAVMPRQDRPNLIAEVAFDFENKAADSLFPRLGAPGEQLLDVWVHAPGRFPGADGAENHDAGVQTTARDRQPRWLRYPNRFRRVVLFAEHEERLWARARVGVRRQGTIAARGESLGGHEFRDLPSQPKRPITLGSVVKESSWPQGRVHLAAQLCEYSAPARLQNCWFRRMQKRPEAGSQIGADRWQPPSLDTDPHVTIASSFETVHDCSNERGTETATTKRGLHYEIAEFAASGKEEAAPARVVHGAGRADKPRSGGFTCDEQPVRQNRVAERLPCGI
jgi:hypothetical protein